MYDKKPPKFIVYIIFIVLILLVSFLIWSSVAIKTYVVKGQGIVTAEGKSNIMAGISGGIKEIFIEEGKEVNEGDVLLILNAVESNLQLDQIKSQIDYDNKRIELLERAERDASKGANSFNKNNLQEVEFYNRLEDQYAKKKEFTIDEETLKNQSYTDDQIKHYKDQQNAKLNQLYYDTILMFTNEKNQLKAEKSKLESQELMYGKSLEEYNVKAARSGKIHLSSPLTKGMTLQAGYLIGSISNADQGLIVEVNISSHERPMIQLGNDVSLAVAGLNQAEYGTINGVVQSIAEDATIDNENKNIFFNVKIRPDSTYLLDKKGEKANLTLGMVTEARINYEKITYMQYFLEHIGIRF